MLLPQSGIVFADGAVSRVDILLDADSLDALLEPGNEYSDHEYPSTFVYTYGNNADTVSNVGLRLRGNTSRVSAKKSFKISFNTFENKSFYGLDKLNLNGEHNDPSIARSKICWDLCRDFEVPGARCNPVELYINSEYKGLYVNVEHVDEEFIGLRFGNNDGNLYKCLWPADLNYKGNNPDLYKEIIYGIRAYDLKTNTAADDYSDLANFIDILNNTSIGNLPDELEEVFNVPGFLRYYAVEVFAGHWDGYAYNKNNYYLYNDPETGMFHFIPYDPDNTLGIDWIGRDWGNRDINDWPHHGEYRPLAERLMEVQEYKDWYNFLMNKLIVEVGNTTEIFPKIEAYRDMVKGYVISDGYHSQDYGYSYTDFINSFDFEQGGHVDYGIKPYLTERVTTALQQLELNDINPIISNVRHNHPAPQLLVNIVAKVEDEQVPAVELFYNVDQSGWVSITMMDNGQGNDGAAYDETFGINIGPFGGGSQIEFYIEAEDNTAHLSRYPRTGSKTILIEGMSPTTLVINEFMAKNTNVISDQNGNFDDWIELFNTGSSPVSLGDKFLSDNPDQPAKWQMPNITLGAGEYYLIWADGEENEGENHSNFKLSAEGEELLLVDSDGSTLIDHVKYYWQSENYSEGRYPNGTGPVQHLGLPTPGYSNVLIGIDQVVAETKITIYPNPFSDECRIEIAGSLNLAKVVEIFSLEGKLVLRTSFSEESFTWKGRDIKSQDLHAGLYFIRITGGHTQIPVTGKIVKL
jgi:spore coat protein CotH